MQPCNSRAFTLTTFQSTAKVLLCQGAILHLQRLPFRLPSHLDGIEAEHVCIARAQGNVGEQVDMAQLPGVQVIYEAAQSKDVALLIIALVCGHLQSPGLTISFQWLDFMPVVTSSPSQGRGQHSAERPRPKSINSWHRHLC